MKKKITFAVLGLSLAAGLAVGNITFAAKANNNDSNMMNSDSMSGMMNDNNMSGMMEMMENPSMSNMMDKMNSPEGKEMTKNCYKYMESQDKEGQPNSKDNGVKPKETSL